jgi:hypothetical protein
MGQLAPPFLHEQSDQVDQQGPSKKGPLVSHYFDQRLTSGLTSAIYQTFQQLTISFDQRFDQRLTNIFDQRIFASLVA